MRSIKTIAETGAARVTEAELEQRRAAAVDEMESAWLARDKALAERDDARTKLARCVEAMEQIVANLPPDWELVETARVALAEARE